MRLDREHESTLIPIPDTIPVLHSVAELLALLQQAPAAYVVCSLSPIDIAFEGRIAYAEAGICAGVFDQPRVSALYPEDYAAFVASGSEAASLLDAAWHADGNGSTPGDADQWAALPLRYGPWCSCWVLANHPEAPSRPAFM